MLKFLITLILIFAALFVLLYFLANPSGGLTSYVSKSEKGVERTVSKGDTLTILTFNMAYGYGIGSDGVGYEPKPKDLIYERLKNIALLINDSKADVVLLQEVDFNASRSGNRDQVDFLLDLIDLKYATSAISWDARYVPFPYLPVSRHFGKVKSGGAILSRFPITDQKTEFLPKPNSNPWYYNWFYLHRYIQKANIDFGFKTYSLFNVHLEAFDITNKKNQANKLKEMVSSESDLLLFGGDFNSLPPYASKISNFDDEYGDDYSGDSTQTIIRSIPGYFEPIQPEASEADYFTFPPLKPNRQLDFLFVRDTVKTIEYKVVNTGDLSDHRPILLQIIL